jgi:hypothetical protein
VPRRRAHPLGARVVAQPAHLGLDVEDRVAQRRRPRAQLRLPVDDRAGDVPELVDVAQLAARHGRRLARHRPAPGEDDQDQQERVPHAGVASIRGRDGREVSTSGRRAVSGAQSWQRIAPATQKAAPISMLGPTPIVFSPIGRRNVPAAAPTRLAAAATPTPTARRSVGNSSVG